MKTTAPLVITISRELGSGGAYIGRKLSEKLNMFYADSEIVTRTAEELSVFEDDVAHHEEKSLPSGTISGKKPNYMSSITRR